MLLVLYVIKSRLTINFHHARLCVSSYTLPVVAYILSHNVVVLCSVMFCELVVIPNCNVVASTVVVCILLSKILCGVNQSK